MRLPIEDRSPLDARAAGWVWPWLAGLVLLGYFGRYGGNNAIPNWWDLVIVAVFAIIVYEVAERLALGSSQIEALIDSEAEDITVVEPR